VDKNSWGRVCLFIEFFGYLRVAECSKDSKKHKEEMLSPPKHRVKTKKKI
jgi:hypothetical protein